MGTTKTLFTISILGLLAGTFGESVVSERLGVDMPWFAQFGLCGLFGAMLWWSMAKTIPTITKEAQETVVNITRDAREAVVEAAKINAEAMGDLKEEFHGLRGDVNRDNEAKMALLREALFRNQGPK